MKKLLFTLVAAANLACSINAHTVCDSLLYVPIGVNTLVNPQIVDLGEEHTGQVEMLVQGDGKLTFFTGLTKEETLEAACHPWAKEAIPPYYIMGSWQKIVLPERRFRYLLIQAERRIDLKNVVLKANRDIFISNLMQRMTLKEKIGQLNLVPTGPVTTAFGENREIFPYVLSSQVGGVFNLRGVHDVRLIQKMAVEQTRLGIPIVFGADVIHGYETLYPIPLAMSCSWDTVAVEQMAKWSAIEASAAGNMWTYSPMVDIAHDARWSRISEGSGEDPFLGAAIARAMVRGYQCNGLLSCIKHFALYGASDGGRDYNTVDMSLVRAMNEYMLPYEAGVREGAYTVMTAFNDWNGVPCHENHWLIDSLLRRQWGFQGVVTADHSGVIEMVNHSVGDSVEVAAAALKAGVDFDMGSYAYVNYLEEALQRGLITETDIDRACQRILKMKWELGLFDNPYKFFNEEKEQRHVYGFEERKIAREIAPETFVLLKNNNNILPLHRDSKIALIGPLADIRTEMSGNWAVANRPEKYHTIMEVLSGSSTSPIKYQGPDSVLSQTYKVRYAQGSNFFYDEKMERRTWVNEGEMPHKDDKKLLEEALRVAKWSDVVVACCGEPANLSGEASCRTNLDIPDAQKDLLKALVEIGKPVVLVLFGGRPLTLTWEKENLDAILYVWQPGSEGAQAIADVLFGDKAPSGKLTTSFPQTVGQEPFHYNHRNTSRPQDPKLWFQKFRSNYIDVSNDAVYPFGYGLTYTSFIYSKPRLSKTELKLDTADTLKVSTTVTNDGQREGDEIVQMYIYDHAASITRPIKELKGFQRIHLKAGESKEVTFSITPETLNFWKPQGDGNPSTHNVVFTNEAGAYSVMIGSNSEDVQTEQFTLR